MSFFGIKKKKGFLDLTKYREKEDIDLTKTHTNYSSPQKTISENAPFFDLGAINSGNLNNATKNNFSLDSSSETDYESSNEKRRKLAKRLMDLTTKIEELSNQIYRLQQRVELIERKVDVNRG